MKKLLSVLTISLLTIAMLSACAGSAAETRYYTLAVDTQSKASKTTPYTLGVKKFSIDPAYASTSIIYRESAYDFMAYNNDQWASAPDHQLTNIVTENLKQSGLFQKVDQRPSKFPDYIFSGYITAIEEVDLDSSDRYARVAIEFTLRNMEKDSVIWQKTYDKKEALEGNGPRAVAKSASKLVNSYTADAVKEMETVLK